MTIEYKFKDLDKVPVSEKYVVSKIVELQKEGYTIAIGSDSQSFYDNISFVTTICAHHRTKGALGYYIKFKKDIKEFPTLRARMSAEAFNSIEMAWWIKEKLPEGAELEVHLDIGNDPDKCATFKFKKELTSIVKSQGFSCKIKPESWASSGVADWFTKT